MSLPSDSMGPTNGTEPTPESVLGHVEFAQRLLDMALAARQEIIICSYDLDRRVYGGEVLVNQLRRFLLEHRRGRLRGLVTRPRQAVLGSHRLVELSRVLASRIEFREPVAAAGMEAADYVIVDQRSLLIRGEVSELEARYYANAPALAREQLQRFEMDWRGAQPAREFGDLHI